MIRKIRIGTRGSDMALAQARAIQEKLQTLFAGLEVEIVIVVTTGDKKQGTIRAENHDKRDWIAGLEELVLSSEIDCALHCAKDVPVDIHDGTVLLPVLKRDAPEDVFISRAGIRKGSHATFDSLPIGSTVAAGSLRRSAIIKRLRPDLQVTAIRGNVPTRLEKLRDNPEVAGMVLAKSGISRLNLENIISSTFTTEEMLPAVNQGMLSLQIRRDAEDLLQVLQRLVDEDTRLVFESEREFIRTIGAGCHSAVAVFGSVEQDESTSRDCLVLRAQVFDPNGTETLSETLSVPVSARKEFPSELGRKLGEIMIDKGAKKFL